jgi:hypothetical protein
MMADLHPAVVYLLAAHERAATLSTAATPGPWEPKDEDPGDDEVYTVHDGEHGDLVGDVVAYVRGGAWRGKPWTELANMQLIAMVADPVAVLRRVTAEREILAEHSESNADCNTCVDGRWGYPIYPNSSPQRYPCRTVLGLAKAWGWEEQS